MFTQRTFLALALCAALAVPSAAQSGDGAACCFSSADFGTDLTGICVTAVPETGVLRLGSRIIRSGDVTVNGETCTQRGKKLRSGDIILVGREIKLVIV